MAPSIHVEGRRREGWEEDALIDVLGGSPVSPSTSASVCPLSQHGRDGNGFQDTELL